MSYARIESLESRRLLSVGDQDMTFGTNGMVAESEIGRLILPAGNDKTYVLTANHVEKHNADGSLDTAFGTAGIAGPANDIVVAHVQSDGKVIVVCGRPPNEDTGQPGAAYSISRFTTTGQLDSTFGTGGRIDVAKAFTNGLSAREFGFQSDGKIVIRITDSDYRHVQIYRLNTNGSVDGTFHVYNYSTLINPDQPMHFAVDSAGKICFPNEARTDSESYALTRLNSDGTLDTSFAQSGHFDPPSGIAIFGLQPTSDGKILIAGVANNVVTDGRTVWRLNSDGSFDDTFGTSVVGGEHGTTVHFGIEFGDNLQLLSSGKILLWNQINVCRLSSDGAFDDSFGRVISIAPMLKPVDLGLTPRFEITGLVEQSDGKLIVGGSDALRRLQADGDMLPAPVQLDDQGTLHVTGMDINDQIAIEPKGTLSLVRARAMIGRVYDTSQIKMISADLGTGDDLFILEKSAFASTVSGGDGIDTLIGGSGDDSLSGNAQTDAIIGNAGNNRLAGNGGRDRVVGGAGNDRIYGGASGDWLYGLDGNDRLEGEGGNDRLFGGAGIDTLNGGAGDDLFVTSGDNAIDIIGGDRGIDSAMSDPDDLLVGIEQVLS